MKYRLTNKHYLIFFLIIILTINLCACNTKINEENKDPIDFLIGMSQANLVEPWRIEMDKEIENEAAKYKNVKIIFTDAAFDSKKQISDIQKLSKQKIDLLIVSPNDETTISPIIKNVYKNIPVIVLDRDIIGYDYTLYIGPDNTTIGKNAGLYVSQLIGKKGGKVIEIQGLEGSPPVSERSDGFKEIIKQQGNISIVSTINANWLRDTAEDKLKVVLKKNPNVDVIFAQNDAMAYGAYLAAKELNIKVPKIVGIDGLLGGYGGINLVKESLITGTFTCSTGGKEAVQYAIDILKHESGIPKKIILRSTMITADNVVKYLDEKEASPKKVIKKANLLVGFSQLGSESEWRIANTLSIRTACSDAGINLIFNDANQSQQKQIDAIKDFIKKKVDVIILSPVVETGWDEILRKAKDAGIPVILSNRIIKVSDQSLYTMWMGSDFEEQGKRAGRWLVSKMKERTKQINVVELRGTSGSTPEIDRKKGFDEILKDYPNFKIIRSEAGDFTKEYGKKMMETILKEQGKNINAVFAHNDDMALGAIEAIEEYGLKPGKDIIIVSVDASKSGFNAMISGKLNCDVENNPILGPMAVKAIRDLTSGKKLPVAIYSQEEVFPSEVAKKEIINRKY